MSRFGGRRAASTARQFAPVVDLHAHFLPKSWPDFASRHGGAGWPSMRHGGHLPSGTFGYGRACDAMLMSGGRDFRPVTRACWDAAARLDDLDAAGVDVQVISATPILFQWERPAAAAVDVARHFNDAALEMCAGSGGRLRALCQVPLQDVDAACAEQPTAATLTVRAGAVASGGCTSVTANASVDVGIFGTLQCSSTVRATFHISHCNVFIYLFS